jgi:hypothetical protein
MDKDELYDIIIMAIRYVSPEEFKNFVVELKGMQKSDFDFCNGEEEEEKSCNS